MVKASPPTLGLALSGGGFRGVAHVGFIKVLREADIPVHTISGSSAGALTAVMTAAGCSIDQMLDFWTEASPFSPAGLSMRQPGLFAADSFAGPLREFVQADRFEDLDVPLIVTLTALVRGEVEYRSEGELLPAVLASSAYPLLFTPVEIGDELYVDGGVTDNLPALPLRERCSHVIGIDVSPSSQPVREDLQSTMGVAQRVFDLLFDASVAPSRQHCDLVIAPPQIRHHPTFSNRDLLEVFRLGEEAARASLPDIQALLAE